MDEINYDEQGYAVIWSERDQEYVGLAKRFPSMSWLAGTHDEALAGIRRVVESLVDLESGNAEVFNSGEDFIASLEGRMKPGDSSAETRHD
ncbi:hypothetical protein [Williamsia muralis]|uniref:hypothetical protein n=1 Tax=Williamsia marianensis TaxID=85044 RepID=UPI000DE70B5A|nr:hypothetical protein [Williamsia marianensis]PVY22506.1 hypothetical protein C7458_1297 [Williamsia marianensis]